MVRQQNALRSLERLAKEPTPPTIIAHRASWLDCFGEPQHEHHEHQLGFFSSSLSDFLAVEPKATV